MLKVGKITEEENKEISDIHEKLIALNNLLLLENLSSEINSNLSEDIRKYQNMFNKWWESKSKKYQWAGREKGNWVVDFSTGEIYLEENNIN